MITVITGGIGSGKSTRLKAIYDQLGGSGLWLPGVLQNGQRVGQNLVRLDTGEETPFCRRDVFLPRDWDEAARLPGYSFSSAGQQFLEKNIKAALSLRGPLFIDEIGPLELNGFGYASWLPAVCALKGRAVFACIRVSCLEQVETAFGLRPDRLIRP